MIISRFEKFSDAQAITATAAATNNWDGKAAGGAIGTEEWFVVRVDEAFNTLTSLTISLVTDTALPIDGSSVPLVSVSVPLADLTLNATVLRVRVPRNQSRYVSAYYTVVGTDPTTGELTAFTTDNIQDNVLS